MVIKSEESDIRPFTFSVYNTFPFLKTVFGKQFKFVTYCNLQYGDFILFLCVVFILIDYRYFTQIWTKKWKHLAGVLKSKNMNPK